MKIDYIKYSDFLSKFNFAERLDVKWELLPDYNKEIWAEFFWNIAEIVNDD